MFATTLVELDKAGQRTGKVAEFPNGLLLTHPLINASPNGAYALQWWLFAGFAVFVWWRVVRDRYVLPRAWEDDDDSARTDQQHQEAR